MYNTSGVYFFLESLGLVLLILFVIWNIIGFSLFGIDKRRAVKQKWRISEATLIFFTVVGAGIGAFAAMRILRHKTQKPKFNIAGWVGLVVAGLILAAIFLLW